MSGNSMPNVTTLRDVMANNYRGPCPSCGATVLAYFINFNLRTLMCENDDCDYPFNDEVQFEKVDPDLASDEEFDSNKVVVLPSSSVDIEPIPTASTSKSNIALKPKKKEPEPCDSDEEIKQNVQKIKELNKELYQNNIVIKTEELETIYRVQDKTGIKLLNDEELEILKKEKVVNEPDEVKFDIDSFNDSISIKIKIEPDPDAKDPEE